MSAYRVWCPDRGEDEYSAVLITAGGIREAACEWAEAHAGFSGDPFDFINCNVREVGTANVFEVGIEVEAVPSFYARIGGLLTSAEPSDHDEDPSGQAVQVPK